MLKPEDSIIYWWNPWLGIYHQWLQQLTIPNEESAMRRYIRHPSNIPISFQIDDQIQPIVHRMRDVSLGGLCITADRPLQRGMKIHINIPITADSYGAENREDTSESKPFEADGIVAWCRPEGPAYTVGVQFADQSIHFGLRMVEQICHIEHYRNDVLNAQGRTLSAEEAAKEWVEKYAAEFPG
jgi:hypothetical protein